MGLKKAYNFIANNRKKIYTRMALFTLPFVGSCELVTNDGISSVDHSPIIQIIADNDTLKNADTSALASYCVFSQSFLDTTDDLLEIAIEPSSNSNCSGSNKAGVSFLSMVFDVKGGLKQNRTYRLERNTNGSYSAEIAAENGTFTAKSSANNRLVVKNIREISVYDRDLREFVDAYDVYAQIELQGFDGNLKASARTGRDMKFTVLVR